MRTWLATALAVLLSACGPAEGPPASSDWRPFEGSWTAVGTRTTLPVEGDRVAATVHLSGAVVLRLGEGLGRGFRGEAIGFDDGAALRVGRWVWTDDRGDRIVGESTGEPIGTGRRVTATITGGTGRYAGLTGEFSFVWQEVVTNAEEGTFHVRTAGLSGRYRRAEARP